MLQDLKQHESSPIDFLDRLPYVLDLLAGVTRTIDKESKGSRTASFSAWWPALAIKLREEITRLRDAELKGLDPQTGRDIDVVVNALAADYPDRSVNDGDSVVTWTWVFSEGQLKKQAVLPVLEQYLSELRQILAEAETRLGQRNGQSS
jgi:hypothetical protein